VLAVKWVHRQRHQRCFFRWRRRFALLPVQIGVQRVWLEWYWESFVFEPDRRPNPNERYLRIDEPLHECDCYLDRLKRAVAEVER
jgi:hypothetical protein